MKNLLYFAAYAESGSSHPISQSLKKAYGEKIDLEKVNNIEEIAGHGVRAVIGGQTVLCGNGKLMQREKSAIRHAPKQARLFTPPLTVNLPVTF